MSDKIQTNSLTMLALFVGPPLLNDQTSFELHSWVDVGEVLTLSEYGSVFGVNNVVVLGSRDTRKLKTSADHGTQTIGLARDLTDAGQIILANAADVDSATVDIVHSGRITFGNGDIDYFQGPLSSYTTTPGDGNATVASTAIFNLNKKVIYA